MDQTALQPLVPSGLLLVLADPVSLLLAGRCAAQDPGSDRLYIPVFPVFFLVSVGEAFIPEKQLSGRRKEAGDRRKPSGFRGWQPGKARGNALVPYERRTGVAVLKGVPLPLGGHGGMAGKEERVVPDEADPAGTAGGAFLEAAGGRMSGGGNASGLRRGGLDGDAL